MPHQKHDISNEADVNPTSALRTLGRLRVPGEGLHTSEGVNFNHTLFARDSAIAARELIDRNPTIAHEAILMLASRQGTKINPKSDEEPGRIHHEDRNLKKWEAGLPNKLVMSAASLIWGGSIEQLRSYFSMDSTPLFAILVADYAKVDPAILKETVRQSDGDTVSIAESLAGSADWMVRHITKDNLVEVARQNRLGLTHQTWKDSLTGYIHENGDSLNLSQPIAYLEIQTLVVDGLIKTAHTLRKTEPEKAKAWEKAAEDITRATLNDFWEEDSQYFVSSIDRDKNGEPRKDGVEQSDPGWMLNTAIFDHLPEADRKKYVSGIVRKLFSKDFLTDAGIRSRSLEYADTLKVADYHGSLVSWPIDTYMAAQGLRRQGMPKLADQLEARILNSANISGDFYEFFYVEKDGTVLVNPNAAKMKQPDAKTLPIQMFPERGIAWTVAATLMIKHRLGRRARSEEQKSSGWEAALEKEILAEIPDISPIKTVEELRKKFTKDPGVYLSTGQGMLESLGDAWEAYRPRRLNKKTKKLSNHAVKTHQI